MKKRKYSAKEKQLLREALAANPNIKTGSVEKKGWVDTPLFLSVEQQKQTKLF